ncbi:unnamed protein product [Fusarium graminearum]|nr:unnamed protein product [Fusarium graminearum]
MLPLEYQHDGSSFLLHYLSFSGVVLAALLIHALRKGYQVRKKFKALEAQGIPIMKHSMIFGHLESVGKLVSSLPPDAHGDYLMMMIRENWRELFPQCTKCPPVAYIDTWLFTAPMVISLNLDVSTQFTTQHSLPKAYEQKHTLYQLTKNRDLASMEGEEWKIWRKRLNPAFSIQNINSRIIDILEEVEDFAAVLKSKAGDDGQWGDVFLFEKATTNLALDVIVRFFLLTPMIKERTRALQEDPTAKGKTLVDLVVQALQEEKAEQSNTANEGKTQPGLEFDTEFMDMVIGQMNTFLFAGFDTTAATVAWLFRLLCQYPDVVAKLHDEHDAVLGTNAWAAANVIREDPQLMNQLPYTLAVLEEPMRYHTNVGTMRRGEPGFFLVGPPGSDPGFDGKKLPTEGFIVWDGTWAVHRDPEIWHRPDEFLPERFIITDREDPLFPPINGWRSFVSGPRNCIGQHLLVLEVKLVMALVTRYFDVEVTWEKWDRAKGTTNAKKAPTIWGDRCYQVGANALPRVKDSMPVHVRVRA